MLDNDSKKLVFNSQTIETIIINPYELKDNTINDFDFTGCKQLKRVSIGNGTSIMNMNGLKGLNNLEVVAFGDFSFQNNANRSFNDMEVELETTYSTEAEATSHSDNNFIYDISAIKGSENLRILNISHLFCVSSEELYNLVISLPNLEQIVGQEINNAEMYSDELIKYCEENNIKHPFTDRSQEIKYKLKEIVGDLIIPTMKDTEKVKVISKYIINNMTYSNGEIKESWGEALYNAVIRKNGLCLGYAELATALFTEANIYGGKLETSGHVYNFFQIDGIYYYIDLTTIDTYIGEDPEEVNRLFSNNKTFLREIDENFITGGDSEKYKNVFSMPAGAREQIADKNTNKDKNKILAIIGVMMSLGMAGVVSINYIKRMTQKGWNEKEYKDFVKSIFQIHGAIKRNDGEEER